MTRYVRDFTSGFLGGAAIALVIVGIAVWDEHRTNKYPAVQRRHLHSVPEEAS